MKNSIYKLIIFSVLSLITLSASGQGSVKPVFGIEWGGSVTVLESFHRNFIAEEGYRVDEKGITSSPRSNGLFIARAGVSFAEHYTATLNTGLIGIRQNRNVVPVSARITYSFRKNDENGMLTFVEGGMIYPNISYVSYLAQSGLGYRINLSRRFKLDLNMSLRMCGDERRIFDPDTGEAVHVWNIRQNKSDFLAAVYSIAICF